MPLLPAVAVGLIKKVWGLLTDVVVEAEERSGELTLCEARRPGRPISHKFKPISSEAELQLGSGGLRVFMMTQIFDPMALSINSSGRNWDTEREKGAVVQAVSPV